MTQFPRCITGFLLVFLPQLLFSVPGSGQRVHVFADGETAIFSELALNTDVAAVWSTDRSSTPGYFSAVADAIYTGAADGTSFLVDGYVKYYRSGSAMASSFVFPVGQGTDYRRVILTGTIPNAAVFATAWFSGDPGTTIDPTDGSVHDRNNKGTGVVSVLAQGFWDWQNLAGTAPDMTITVSIPDVSAHALTSNLILVGWDGSEWINLSGAAGAGPYANNWADGNTENSLLSGAWVPGITALGIGSLSYPLPLKLQAFNGKMNGCTVELSWKTSWEENTSHFTVQSTIDGIRWQSLINIEAQGDGSGSDYKYSVIQNEQTVRYRLLMADKDGQLKYSQVLTLTGNCIPGEYMKVFPNPVKMGSGALKILMLSRHQGRAHLIIRNTAGQVLLSRNIMLKAGSNTLDLEIGSFLPGTYLLSLINEQNQILYPPQKIIKN